MEEIHENKSKDGKKYGENEREMGTIATRSE